MLKSSAHSRPGGHGFSLVEVVIALGVLAVALVALIGLLPRGMLTNQETREETEAIGLVRHLVAERRAVPFTKIIPKGLPRFETIPPDLPLTSRVEANFTDRDWGDRRYRVEYSLHRPPAILNVVTGAVEGSRTSPYLVFLRVSWPADTANSKGSVESLASFTFP